MVANQLLPSDALYHLPALSYLIIVSITPNISINFIQYSAQFYISINIIMDFIIELHYSFLYNLHFKISNIFYIY